MALSDFIGQFGAEVGVGGGAVNNFLYGFIVFIVIAIAVGVGSYLSANKRAYSKKIHIFGEISGNPAPLGEDLAREVTLPFTSVRAFYLKKGKLFLPRPSIQIGKDHFWYFIRDDGEWVNIGMSNLNEEMTKLNIKYDHTDIRMANAYLKKLVEKNYKKINWLKEYAPYIGFAILILMMGVSMFLVMGEAGKVVSGTAGNVENLEKITASLDRILSNMDKITVSSGIREVG